MIYDHIIPGNPSQMITEFPLFSFILGDIHPHVLALPTVLLAVGVALGFWVRPAGWRRCGDTALSARRAGDRRALSNECLGLADIRAAGRRGDCAAAARWDGPAHHPVGGILVGAVVLFLPYYLHFKSLVGHRGDEPPFIQNLEATPLLGTIIKMFGVVTWPHTSLGNFSPSSPCRSPLPARSCVRGCIGAPGLTIAR